MINNFWIIKTESYLTRIRLVNVSQCTHQIVLGIGAVLLEWINLNTTAKSQRGGGVGVANFDRRIIDTVAIYFNLVKNILK